MTTGFVWSVEAADLLTPVAAYMKLSSLVPESATGRPYRLLFESVEGGATRGRYSVIALLPDLVWRCTQGRVEIDHAPLEAGSAFCPVGDAPLVSLRKLVEESRAELPEGLPTMIGGVFGYLGYDMVRHMEVLPEAPPDDLGLPDGVMMRPGLFAVFDSVRDELYLAVPLREGGMSREEAESLLGRARMALATVAPDPADTLPAGTTLAPPRSTVEAEAFRAKVRVAQDYIAAGDAFQIVPSQRFSTGFPLPSLALYRSLRRVNPAPFLFLVELDGFSLVGSSPEILVRLREGVVTVRPLAGTRPRGADRDDDLRLERELLADQKERAEHLMLIDLGRNDVGRVSRMGSVSVPASFVIERYSHVMHISSTVHGAIRPECDAIDALEAAFPAGTLTGAPKIRAMEIIDELEATRRGPYAGCIGYFGADGDMDTCIGLRMAILHDGQMHVQAGCGVVADSDPEAEEMETRHKSRAIFRAAELAVKQAACAIAT
ncbi:anthranilate synthase component I [Swaminathania salitolerans]|uniref:Anthranilate synthase component 1 n=1 Tax=Swaminathania salitolerans TaxID=182838 RepID=A0A511BP45_9PROT|nr:anthranilate synthase component I [Swaminathania salitolerans]GBQ15264.1 anthranilate synthase component I [Swaminathania salitolerans LMG 21291]GEL02045.1 anthranilate synthase component I [Swaminathania salitolerans]